MTKQIETHLHMVEYHPWSTMIKLLHAEDKKGMRFATPELWQRGKELASKKEISPERLLLRTWLGQLNEPAVVIDRKEIRASKYDLVDKLNLTTTWARQVYELNRIADTGNLMKLMLESFTKFDKPVSEEVALTQMFHAVSLSEYIRFAITPGMVNHYDVKPNGAYGKDGQQGVLSPRGRYPVNTL